MAALAVAMAATLVLMSLSGCGGTGPRGDGSVGSRLYYARCRLCHSPYDPASKAAGWWRDNLDRYAQRAHLTASERDSVMAFVVRAKVTDSLHHY